jgi:hypothetical protein
VSNEERLSRIERDLIIIYGVITGDIQKSYDAKTQEIFKQQLALDIKKMAEERIFSSKGPAINKEREM